MQYSISAANRSVEKTTPLVEIFAITSDVMACAQVAQTLQITLKTLATLEKRGTVAAPEGKAQGLRQSVGSNTLLNNPQKSAIM